MSENSLQTICAVKRPRDKVSHLGKFQLYLYKGEDEPEDLNLGEFYDKSGTKDRCVEYCAEEEDHSRSSLTCCTTTDSISDIQDFLIKSYPQKTAKNSSSHKRGRFNDDDQIVLKARKSLHLKKKLCDKNSGSKERLMAQMSEFKSSISFVKKRRFFSLNVCEVNLMSYLTKFGLLPDNCKDNCDVANTSQKTHKFVYPVEFLKDNDRFRSADLMRYNASYLFRTTRNIFEDFERKRADEMTRRFEGYCRRKAFVLPDVSAFEEHTEFTSRYII